MGIDFSHCDAHWGYGGFNRMRTNIAALAGITLDNMEGFGGKIGWKNIVDPIKHFLNHSDCDGILTAKECEEIAPRLKELAAKLEDAYDKTNALELARGMEEAASAGESLKFC
jgi:hypothetical protein